jgi:hypothetical protein
MEAAMKIKAKPATAFVSTEKKHKGTVLHETGKQLEVVLAKQFEMEPCMVGMEASLTINLGDFNSARVACSLRVPCRHEEIVSEHFEALTQNGEGSYDDIPIYEPEYDKDNQSVSWAKTE